MKTKLLVGMLLAGSSLFAETHFSIGIGVGGNGYAARPAVAYAPARPGPGYTWVNGYWSGVGHRRVWHEGYWARPSYGRAYVGASRYDGRRNDGYRDNGNHFESNRFDNDHGRR